MSETAFDFCEPVAAGGQVAYLRRGRARWGRGQITAVYPDGSVKILPARSGWKSIVVTPEELNAIARPGLVVRAEVGSRPEPVLVATECPAEMESYWWPLWKHMSDEHGLTLVESECVDIARAVDEVRRKDFGKSA